MMRARLLRAWLLALAVAIPTGAAGAATLDVAWWRDGKLSALELRDDGRPPGAGVDGARLVPLGSVWKLFVYLYTADIGLATPDYTCGGRDPDEVYCCTAGQSIGRDAALARSCGLFFAPARLQLAPRPWRRYWSARLKREPDGEFDWLADPRRLGPERLVTLRSLLRALAAAAPASRAEAESALLRVVLDGRGGDTVRWFGGRLRVKTFSWHRTGRPRERLGGAAGWLADGTPVWFAGAGTSAHVLRRWAAPLAAALPQPAAAGVAGGVAGGDPGCVLVDYFARYPIRAVRAVGAAGPVAPGALNGRYQVRFENGQSLAFSSAGELALRVEPDGRRHLDGRLGVNEYVARVIEREASAAEPEAAKALAIAARTYLLQNARRSEGCQRIADSSATQRVSPNPAGAAARALARWTDQLVLAGVNVRYHRDRTAPDTLVWRDALEQARRGQPFDAILAAAYPRAELTTLDGAAPLRCTRLPGAEAWLARELRRWERLLSAEPGYERPPAPPAVCELAFGAPYSEQSRNRIFLPRLASREDRITLAHEFLHLGLRHHPRGRDEAEVERLARRMVDLKLEGL